MTLDPLLPWWLFLLVALALLGYVAFATVRAPRSLRGRWLGRGMTVLALLAAVARPGVGTVAAAIADENLDVVFVVDVSPSIAAEDWADGERRLEGVKADIEALAAAHPGARFSLITFSNSAVQRFPFLADTVALETAVDTLYPEDAYFTEGSSPFAASKLLIDVLDSAAQADPEGERARLVYYFGDGEITAETVKGEYDEAAELINGGAVFGYGTHEGGKIPAFDSIEQDYGDYINDHDTGSDGISKIDEEVLGDIAEQLDVPYVHRDADTGISPAEVNLSRGSLSGQAASRLSFPIYWVFALVVVGWMLVETVVLARTARELRDATALRDALDDAALMGEQHAER